MSQLMMRRLFEAKKAQLFKREHVPFSKLSPSLRSVVRQFKVLASKKDKLRDKINAAGFSAHEITTDSIAQGYDWIREHDTPRSKALSELRFTADIEMMKAVTGPQRAAVLEKFKKRIDAI